MSQMMFLALAFAAGLITTQLRASEATALENGIVTATNAPPERSESFSTWLHGNEYQQNFDSMVKRGFYPVYVEGKSDGEKSLFRARFAPTPKAANFAFHSFHGITIGEYRRRTTLYGKRGYAELSCISFVDQSGVERRCGTWTKTMEGTQLREGVDEPVQRAAAATPDRFGKDNGVAAKSTVRRVEDGLREDGLRMVLATADWTWEIIRRNGLALGMASVFIVLSATAFISILGRTVIPQNQATQAGMQKERPR